MEPDIRKLNLFYYTNIVHGYFREANVQQKAFIINSEKTIATLALPLEGIRTENNNIKIFCIDISSMADKGAGKISLFGSIQTTTEITFKNLTEFESSMEKMLPLDPVNKKSRNETLEINKLVKMVEDYLNLNKIRHPPFEIDKVNHEASLDLPLDGIETNPDGSSFSIDLLERKEAKTVIYNINFESLNEWKFSTEKEFSDSIQIMLPLKTKKMTDITTSCEKLRMRIEKIEKKIEEIMKILKEQGKI